MEELLILCTRHYLTGLFKTDLYLFLLTPLLSLSHLAHRWIKGKKERAELGHDIFRLFRLDWRAPFSCRLWQDGGIGQNLLGSLSFCQPTGLRPSGSRRITPSESESVLFAPFIMARLVEKETNSLYYSARLDLIQDEIPWERFNLFFWEVT